MNFKPRIKYRVTILVTSTLLLLFMPFTDSAFSAAEEKSLYIIHVSSFKNQNDAEVEISRFLEQGLQAFYRYEPVEGKGNWFRVFIGTFKNRQEAKAKGLELLEEGMISYAAPREVKPDFIPGRKTVEVEINAEEPTSLPVIEEEPPQVEVPQEPAAKPMKEPVEPTAIEEKPPQAEAPQEPVAKPVEKEVQESPAPEREIAMDRGKMVEDKPKRESSLKKLNLSLALNGGAYISRSAEDFEITEETPSTIWIYSFTGVAYQISLEPSMTAYKDLDLYGRVEFAFADDVDIFFISLGPKLRFNLSGSVFPYISDWVAPYIKGGFVWGDFSFDNVPGEFDDGFGYEGGFGLEILKFPYNIGLDLLYRDIAFDYISPGIEGVTANDSSIDVSGFSMSGTFTYFF